MKTNFKKALALLLAMIFILSFGACQKNTPANPDKNNPTSPPEPTRTSIPDSAEYVIRLKINPEIEFYFNIEDGNLIVIDYNANNEDAEKVLKLTEEKNINFKGMTVPEAVSAFSLLAKELGYTKDNTVIHITVASLDENEENDNAAGVTKNIYGIVSEVLKPSDLTVEPACGVVTEKTKDTVKIEVNKDVDFDTEYAETDLSTEDLDDNVSAVKETLAKEKLISVEDEKEENKTDSQGSSSSTPAKTTSNSTNSNTNNSNTGNKTNNNSGTTKPSANNNNSSNTNSGTTKKETTTKKPETTTTTTKAPASPERNYGYASQFLSLLNSYRASLGLSQLGTVGFMQEHAMQRAYDLTYDFSHNYHGRNPLSGCPIVQDQYGDVYQFSPTGGECIGGTVPATPSAMLEAFKASGEHNAILTKANITHVGVGVVSYNGNDYYCVSTYAENPHN